MLTKSVPKRRHLKTIVGKQHSCLLSFEASLGPSAGYSALEELILGVEEDGLVAGYDVHSHPELPAKWILMNRDHRHLVVHHPGEVVHFAVLHHGVGCLLCSSSLSWSRPQTKAE